MEQLFVYETQGTVMNAFFRHYLTMKIFHIPKQGQVYEEFKLHHLNCECAISEVWICFRFDRICFRERAQNQKVSCHVECIVSMVKKEK